MYLLAILGILLCLGSVVCFLPGGGIRGIVNYIDFVSLIMMLVTVIPFLFSSGLSKDFINAFQLVFGKKKDATLLKLKRALLAVKTVIRLLIYGGVMIAFLSVIVLLHNMSDPAYLGPALAVTILSILYALVVIMLLLPIRARLEVLILEYIQPENGHAEKPEYEKQAEKREYIEQKGESAPEGPEMKETGHI